MMAKDKHRDCTELEHDLILYYYGELTGEDRAKVENHLQRCAFCTTNFNELSTLLPMTVESDEPSQLFWDNYSREMRHKLDAAAERRSWVHALGPFLEAWTVPALATAAVLVLAITLTLGKGTWTKKDSPTEEEPIVEVLPIAENLEFFRTMEVLDSMELLEYLGQNGAA
jgi:predicted anti-sigma-YlaC factor YlaD